MAVIEANVIPVDETTVKLNFIGYLAPKSDGLLEVTYEGDTFNVILSGHGNNSWCIVDASFSDFDNKTRVLIGGDFPEPPETDQIFENQFENQFE
jgi:hypothetical protein